MTQVAPLAPGMVKIQVINPYKPDFGFSCILPLKSRLSTVKTQIEVTYPGYPKRSDQKLIFSGRMYPDETLLQEILEKANLHANGDNVDVLHCHLSLPSSYNVSQRRDSNPIVGIPNYINRNVTSDANNSTSFPRYVSFNASSIRPAVPENAGSTVEFDVDPRGNVNIHHSNSSTPIQMLDPQTTSLADLIKEVDEITAVVNLQRESQQQKIQGKGSDYTRIPARSFPRNIDAEDKKEDAISAPHPLRRTLTQEKIDENIDVFPKNKISECMEEDPNAQMIAAIAEYEKAHENLMKSIALSQRIQSLSNSFAFAPQPFMQDHRGSGGIAAMMGRSSLSERNQTRRRNRDTAQEAPLAPAAPRENNANNEGALFNDLGEMEELFEPEDGNLFNDRVNIGPDGALDFNQLPNGAANPGVRIPQFQADFREPPQRQGAPAAQVAQPRRDVWNFLGRAFNLSLLFRLALLVYIFVGDEFDMNNPNFLWTMGLAFGYYLYEIGALNQFLGVEVSLANVFNRMSQLRFTQVDIPQDENRYRTQGLITAGAADALIFLKCFLFSLIPSWRVGEYHPEAAVVQLQAPPVPPEQRAPVEDAQVPFDFDA